MRPKKTVTTARMRDSGVRSLNRGLALLVALNRRKLASVCDLAEDTHLPRPTVYRLLASLSDSGFVCRDPATDRYRPTQGVRALSDGYLDDDWIAEIAAPLMDEFTREHVWPLSLFTFDLGQMLVRETTLNLSPLSIDYGMVGKRMPMLRTACGLVYLAFCSDNEREAILDLLKQSSQPGEQQTQTHNDLNRLLAVIRTNGYASQERAINPKAAGISVPIMVNGKIYGCISLIYIASAITLGNVEKKLLPPLQAMVRRLRRALQAEQDSSIRLRNSKLVKRERHYTHEAGL